MGMKSAARISAAAMLVTGFFILTGCGAKQTVKPVEAPVAEVVATPEPTPTPQRYTVTRGDTLWGIAGQNDIYGDHFQWPLIFKANRDQIQDPDIIEIGQDFAISHEFSQQEVSTAIENAKKTPRYKHHKKPRKRLPIEY
jgi:predicted small lipoprotein YifL